MTNKNDEKIKVLLKNIENKKKTIGNKPRGLWETNGNINGKNINTINTIDSCISLAAELFSTINLYKESCTFLEVDIPSNDLVKGIQAALNDVKLRSKMIKWDYENKKLVLMENQLKDLRSEDAKTEDTLAEFESSLK